MSVMFQLSDPSFLVDDARLDRIADVVKVHWPERTDAAQMDEQAL